MSEERFRLLLENREDFMRKSGRLLAQSNSDSVSQDKPNLPLNPWKAIHTYSCGEEWSESKAKQWFYETWIKTVPSSCCRNDFDHILRKIPPVFNSQEQFEQQGIDWHNEVNKNHFVGKTRTRTPVVPSWLARVVWKSEKDPSQAALPFIAVTSITRNVDRKVLQSWVQFGLRIVCVQTTAEVKELRSEVPEVSEWVECDELSEHSKPSQRIYRLLRVAVEKNTPILLINSDCELHGSNLWIPASRKIIVWQRRNYTDVPGDGSLELDGLDAFLVWPEHAACVNDIGLAIGRPFWDYWLPYLIESLGFQIDWRPEPLIYHRAHPIRWSNEDWKYGYNLFRAQLGYDLDWAAWRRSKPHGRTL